MNKDRLRRTVREAIRTRTIEGDAGRTVRRLLVQAKQLRSGLISNDDLYAFEGYEFDEREMATALDDIILILERYTEFASLHKGD